MAFLSCSDSNTKLHFIEDGKKAKHITATLWQRPPKGCFYDDLRITPSYYIFLDSGSDTAIRVYKPHIPDKPHSFHTESRHILDAKNEFIVSNTRFTTSKDEVWISDRSYQLRKIIPDGDRLLSEETKNIFKDLSNVCMDINITTDEIYVVDIGHTRKYLYGFFRPDSGFYWVDPPKYAKTHVPKADYVNLGNLLVSEKHKSAVFARRFVNDILFFDLHGNLKASAIIGNQLSVPKTKNNQVDIDNTLKFSIYLCATDKYIYCLHDGSNDYTANSKIYVFDWNGRHIRTYHTDRCLKQIAVDSKDSYILALATNENNGRDVVKIVLSLP